MPSAFMLAVMNVAGLLGNLPRANPGPHAGFLLVLGAACIRSGVSRRPTGTYPTMATLDESQLPLGPGDKLTLTVFYGAHSITAPYTLDASGEIVGPVHRRRRPRSARRCGAGADEITTRLADGYLKDPIVVADARRAQLADALGLRHGARKTGNDQVHSRHDDHRRDRAERRVHPDGAQEHGPGHARHRQRPEETYKLPVEMIAEGDRPNFPMMPGRRGLRTRAPLVAAASRPDRLRRHRRRSLVASVLAVGGVFRWTQALVAVLVGLRSSQRSSRRAASSTGCRRSSCCSASRSVFTAIQLDPAARRRARRARSGGYGAAHRRRGDRGHAAVAVPLDGSVAGTLRALVFFVTLFGVALAQPAVRRLERGRFCCSAASRSPAGSPPRSPACTCIVNATSSTALRAVHAAPPILGPLLNPNHLGCLMAFGATISVGLAFYEQAAARAGARCGW